MGAYFDMICPTWLSFSVGNSSLSYSFKQMKHWILSTADQRLIFHKTTAILNLLQSSRLKMKTYLFFLNSTVDYHLQNVYILLQNLQPEEVN